MTLNDVATVDTSAELQARGAEMKAEQAARNNTQVKNVLKRIGSVFVPLIPAFVAVGMVGAVSSLLALLIGEGILTGAGWLSLQTVLNVIQRTLFTLLPILVGICAAQEFGATPALGGIIAGITMLSGITAGVAGTPCPPNTPTCLANIFNGRALQPGYGGVLGVLLAVWLLSRLEKLLRRYIPDSLDIILTPLISILVIGLLTILVIMPLTGLISEFLVSFVNFLLSGGGRVVGAISGFVLGGLFLPLVMVGMHQVLTVLHVELINAQGATPLFPILAMAGAGQVGAVMAVWLRCRRNRSLAQMIKGALPLGFLGIGEPLIYGVTLPLGRAFVTACLGGAVGGAVIGLLGGLGSTAIGPSGLLLIPMIAGGLWWAYLIALLAAYLAGFLLTYFFGVPKSATLDDSI